MANPNLDLIRRQLDRIEAAQDPAVERGGGGSHNPPMEIGERLARVEAGLDWIKVILAIIASVMIGGFALFGVQINRLDTKIDGIGPRISEEAARTRQEMVAITNAIANSITATRQAQPAPAPQIVIVPPGTPPPPPKQ